MATSNNFFLHGCFSLLALFLTGGCGGSSGPELGQVHGVVTLDGNPIEGADVMFNPVAEGRGSLGTTDANGNYTLQYTNNQTGATVGEHSVVITTKREGFSDESGAGQDVEARAEMLPAKYHEDTELTATVNEGDNTIDFELTSN